MFERWTERARQVAVFAQEEARELKHHHIGTEHILLGLLREEEGLAARTLESLNITVERVRAQVIRIVGVGEEDPGWKIPFTLRAKKVLELALREALSLGHNYISTEHILLGLIRENASESVAAFILRDFDADPEKVRNEVLRLLTGRRAHPVTTEPDTVRLPRGVRLGHVDAVAESWEAYDRLPWQETRTFDVVTGEPHPSKSNGRITVIPPVNVPRDGEFSVKRERELVDFTDRRRDS